MTLGRVPQHMEWSEGSTIIKGILCLWSSTIVPDKPPISSLGWLMLLFLFRTVIKLDTGSLLIEQCSFIVSLRQEGQDYLDGNRKRETSWSSLERFLTTVAETLQHMGAQSVSLWAS